MKTILITGGCGFMGHHAVEHFIKNTDWNIVVLDKLTYSSKGFDRLRDINCFDSKRVKVLTADLSQPLSDGIIHEIGKIDYIIHFAAETHVDRSIENAIPFVHANVLGTAYLLEYARTANIEKMIYFSTDEVFGPVEKGKVNKEWDTYNSSNPYAATKAGGEELCLAYANTYKLPIVITHTMNLFGERQHPEKFIPMTIRKVLAGETVIIHGDPTKTISGTRFYIHCRNAANALHFLLDKGKIRDKYNIVGEKEVSNLEMAQFIAKVLDKPLKYEIVDFHSSRPGHDLHYGLDGRKMFNMGWSMPISFEKSLEKTIRWTLDRKDDWL